MQKGLEINFYDMLREIRKKWAILLAFALVFAVAANFYGYRRASLSAERERRALEEYAQSMGTTVDALPEHMTVELAELRGALTEEEASFVEAAAKLYMYRMWASDKINAELVVGEPDGGDLEIVQTLYYANEGVQSATQAMTSAEKSYYNVLVKGLSGTDMSSTEKDISSPGFLQPKWLVIGCALGALLGICCIALRYMLSGKLRTAADMESPYGVPVLAELTSADDPEIDSAVKGLCRLMKEKQRSSIALCSADSGEALRVRDRVKELLNTQGITVCEVSAGDDGLIGKVSDAESVLFVEQIGKSRYKEIEKNTAACRKFCIPTAGCVVIK